MLPSIALSQFISFKPGVIQAGANAISMNALMLDNSGDTSIPIGTVAGFPSVAALIAWYGAATAQAILGADYFAGNTGASQYPGLLYVAQYNAAAVAGYLRGGVISGLTLTQLQAIPAGTITVLIDAVSHVSLTVTLSGATSFSNAAGIIQTALQGGTPSTTATVTYDALRGGFVITSSTTGATSSLAYPTTNTTTTGLLLTSATGAVLSPGAAIATPAGTMNSIVASQPNWASFFTVLEPTLPLKEGFAAWVQSLPEQYLYIDWDSDITPTQSTSATGSFGNIVQAANDDGVFVLWNPGTAPGTYPGDKAAAVAGWIASINFNAPNGDIDFSWKSQAGLVPDVTNQTVYINLIANGYSAYVAMANRANYLLNLQPGTIAGQWGTLRRYVNQMYWTAAVPIRLGPLHVADQEVPVYAAGL